MESICNLHRLGVVPYEEAWRLQDRLAKEIAAGERPATLLLLEHPHTYTFGRRGKIDNLLWDQAELERRGVSVHWVDRGGDVTYHGPGQLVGYPLLPLGVGKLVPAPAAGQDAGPLARLPQADYVGYLRKLEITIIAALARLGVPSEQLPGLTGVWVRAEAASPDLESLAKIAAIGVKVDARGVSRHGFALNVDADMAYWDGIIGCGLKDTPVASLADFLQPPPAMDQVCAAVAAAFAEVFALQVVESPLEWD
jgi:lipoate-protein ligase B